MVILKFKGIDDRNDVERMRQAKLLVTRENAVELGKDEYFIADLIGIQVVSDEGEELGTISDVLQTGANDVYVVSKDGAKDLLIPAIHACIQNVDVAAQPHAQPHPLIGILHHPAVGHSGRETPFAPLVAARIAPKRSVGRAPPLLFGERTPPDGLRLGTARHITPEAFQFLEIPRVEEFIIPEIGSNT